MAKKDLYEILGIVRSASQDEIKKAYRKIALKYHPDRNQGDKVAEDKFKEAASAYEVLSDEVKRSNYDLSGNADTGSGGGGGFGGFGGYQNMEDIFRNFGDVFRDDPFGQSPFDRATGMGAQNFGQRNQPKEKGGTIRVIIKLTLEDVVNGVKKKLKLSKGVQCKKCWGTGTMNTASIKPCSVCNGSGSTKTVRQTILGKMEIPHNCRACDGTGREHKSNCPDCAGKGVVQGEEIFPFHIPAGQTDGAQLLFTGKGHAGDKGGIAGDLIIEMEIDKTHPFVIDGRDLVYHLNVSIPDAILGAQVEVPTIDGKVKFDVPAGSSSGSQFRIRGKGIPTTKNAARGDIRVVASIYVPEKLNTEERRMMLGLKNSENFKAKNK